jgi:hypothetical protein
MVSHEVYGWVVQQAGRYAGQVYPLMPRTTLGSDPACDIVVPGAAARHVDLVLDDRGSWTVHVHDDAEIRLDGERAKGSPWPIADGATLDLNSIPVIFKCVAREAAPRSR